MNLFEKIAKEQNDNSGSINTGLGALTLGGLGAGAYYGNEGNKTTLKKDKLQSQADRYNKDIQQRAHKISQMGDSLDANVRKKAISLLKNKVRTDKNKTEHNFANLYNNKLKEREQDYYNALDDFHNTLTDDNHKGYLDLRDEIVNKRSLIRQIEKDKHLPEVEKIKKIDAIRDEVNKMRVKAENDFPDIREKRTKKKDVYLKYRDLKDNLNELVQNNVKTELKQKYKGSYKNIAKKIKKDYLNKIESLNNEKDFLQNRYNKINNNIGVLDESINKLSRNSKLGLGIAGLGALGLGYNYLKNN